MFINANFGPFRNRDVLGIIFDIFAHCQCQSCGKNIFQLYLCRKSELTEPGLIVLRVQCVPLAASVIYT